MMTIPRSDHTTELTIDRALLSNAPAKYLASHGIPFNLALRIMTRPDLRRGLVLARRGQ